MYRQKDLRKQIQYELERCEQLYRKLKIEQKFLPKGSLAIDIHDNLYRTGRIERKQYKVLLDNSEISLINKLKKRRYTTEALKILQQRIENCKAFLEKDTFYDPKTIEKQLPKQYSGLKGVNIFLQDDINVEDWINEPYKINSFPIKTPHYTAKNLCTRSKSEAMIATRADDCKLIYRYDAEVVLGNKSVYPDFTFLDTKRRRILYLEHLGKVDDESYVLRNLRKLEEYAECGIVLGENLFITYESQNKPLSISDIDNKLDEMFGRP